MDGLLAGGCWLLTILQLCLRVGVPNGRNEYCFLLVLDSYGGVSLTGGSPWYPRPGRPCIGGSRWLQLDCCSGMLGSGGLVAHG